MRQINAMLKQYIISEIIPQYADYDKGHSITHIEDVISNSIEIAEEYDIDTDMIFTVAAYHDIGIRLGRKDHNITSAQLMSEDIHLNEWFSEEQIKVMAEAIEDHRASNNYEPRSIYGKIVSEADRSIDPENIVLRTIEYGITNFPELSFDEQLERCYNHIMEKYGENGYIKLWLNTKRNTDGLKVLRELSEDKESFFEICKKYKKINTQA